MQIKVSKEQPKFDPVTLTVVFQTAEELQTFKKMCGFNRSVADKVFEENKKLYPNSSYDADKLNSILSLIWHDL